MFDRIMNVITVFTFGGLGLCLCSGGAMLLHEALEVWGVL